MDEFKNSIRESSGRSYVIATGIVPDKAYALDENHCIRAIKPPPVEITDQEEIPDTSRMDVMVALSGSDSFDIYKDLIVFHSFLTYEPISLVHPIHWEESETYLFAEHTTRARYDDSEIEPIDPSTLSHIGVDFDHFRVAVNVGVKPVFRYVNYRYAFSIFLGLKRKAGTRKIRDRNKRLYDQIHLWEFARHWVRMHRIYSNDYFPIAICMTILESLVGRPNTCRNKEECRECGRPMEHDTVSWSKHFRRNYIRRVTSHDIELISRIRNDMYHRGNFFDWFEEYDKIVKMGGKADKKDVSHVEDVESVQNEIFQVSRRKLLHELLKRCSLSQQAILPEFLGSHPELGLP
jgi:hypothetical protein